MKYIALHPTTHRCRPRKPLTQLHNDCGQQDVCARRLAANTTGSPEHDFSMHGTPMGATVMCPFYVSLADAERHRDAQLPKRLERES